MHAHTEVVLNHQVLVRLNKRKKRDIKTEREKNSNIGRKAACLTLNVCVCHTEATVTPVLCSPD